MPDITEQTEEENYDDEEEETLAERLWGLTEMFPDSIRNTSSAAVGAATLGGKKLYGFTRSALWVGTACFVMLAVPVVFEQERYNLEQQQQQHQRQLLLGPNAAVSNSPGLGMAPMPPVAK